MVADSLELKLSGPLEDEGGALNLRTKVVMMTHRTLVPFVLKQCGQSAMEGYGRTPYGTWRSMGGSMGVWARDPDLRSPFFLS